MRAGLEGVNRSMRFSLGLVGEGMIKPLLPAIALLAATSAPLAAQDGVVDLQTAIRCSAAFGVVAAEQQRGEASAIADYPPLTTRGREFFVQTGARLMDEGKMTREQVERRLRSEIASIDAEMAGEADRRTAFRAIMTPCLALLDATVPVRR